MHADLPLSSLHGVSGKQSTKMYQELCSCTQNPISVSIQIKYIFDSRRKYLMPIDSIDVAISQILGKVGGKLLRNVSPPLKIVLP